MPKVVRANTNSAVMMIAEKSAAMIKEDHGQSLYVWVILILLSTKKNGFEIYSWCFGILFSKIIRKSIAEHFNYII